MILIVIKFQLTFPVPRIDQWIISKIEVKGLQMSSLDNSTKQHFKEIERLKKLVGADLTFHGPLVEPTGIGQGGWDPSQRE